MLGPVRVVGLGEATHGSRELVTPARRLLAYLVTEEGFDVFASEADHEGGTALDAEVTTGEGDPVGSDNLPPARERLTSPSCRVVTSTGWRAHGARHAPVRRAVTPQCEARDVPPPAVGPLDCDSCPATWVRMRRSG